MITKQKLNKFVDEEIKDSIDFVQSEADTITSLVVPFIELLGYKTNKILEYRREYQTAYFGNNHKVDIALLAGENNPIIYLECKKYGHKFGKRDIGQLEYYYGASKKNGCKDLTIAILTDGDRYRLFSETKDTNHLDSNSFLEFTVSDPNSITNTALDIINLLTKDKFDKKLINDIAYQSVYLQGVINSLKTQFKAPEAEFVKLLVKPLLKSNARITDQKLKEFTPIVHQATQFFKNNLKGSDDPINEFPEIETTEEEIYGYRLVLSILQNEIKIERLIHHDTPECFFIRIDGEVNKILCSFWFNNTENLKLGLYGKEINKVKKYKLDDVKDIKDYADKIKERLNFLEPKKLEPDQSPKQRRINLKSGVYKGSSIEIIYKDTIRPIPHGKGKLEKNNGEIDEGLWKRGVIVEGKTRKDNKIIKIHSKKS